MSRVIAIILLRYLHHRLACHGLLITTDNALPSAKPSATKMPENCWRTRQLPMAQMRQRDVAALDAKYTKSQLMC